MTWPTKYMFDYQVERATATMALYGMAPHEFSRKPGSWLIAHPEFLVIDRGGEIEIQRVPGTPADLWMRKEWYEVPPDILKALAHYALLELHS